MNAYLNGEMSARWRDPAEEMPDIPVSISSAGASRNLRARAVLDHGRQRRREPVVVSYTTRLGDRLAH